MAFGKAVRIFLPDATVTGVRQVEIVNRTGHALACPRSRLDELKNWPETGKPGVYLLFEARLGDSKPLVYVGESENVRDRVLTHDRNKEFWNDVVIFTSKDDNLTKSHVKYLESRLEAVTRKAGRYELENGNTPTQSNLPRAERESMEELLDDIRIVLGTLGYPVLESLVQGGAGCLASQSVAIAAKPSSEVELTFKVNRCVAHGVQTEEGFVIKKGSMAAKEGGASLNAKIQALRQKMIDDGRFRVEDDHLMLLEDVLMSSSSYAATLVAGTSRSGPQSWFAPDGRSLKTIEDSVLDNLVPVGASGDTD